MNAKQGGILDRVSVELSALHDGNRSRNPAYNYVLDVGIGAGAKDASEEFCC